MDSPHPTNAGRGGKKGHLRSRGKSLKSEERRAGLQEPTPRSHRKSRRESRERFVRATQRRPKREKPTQERKKGKARGELTSSNLITVGRSRFPTLERMTKPILINRAEVLEKDHRSKDLRGNPVSRGESGGPSRREGTS